MKKIFNVLICTIFFSFIFLDVVNAVSLKIDNNEISANNSKTIIMNINETDLSDYNEIKFDLDVVMVNEEDKGKVKIDKVEISQEKMEAGIVFSFEEFGWKIEKTDGLPQELELNIYITTQDITGNFTIKPVNVWLHKEESESIPLGADSIKEGTIKYTKPRSNDATLESIVVKEAINEYALTPEFDKNITEYSVNLEENIGYINISVTTAPKATCVGNGRKSLELGKNEFEIKVTAEDGETTKTYKVIVYRGKSSEPSAYLSSLKITTKDLELSPRFDKMNNKYTVDAPYGTEKIDIEYVLQDKGASIEITGNEDFNVGENKILIKISASDKSDTQEYEIIVNVDEEKSKPAKPLDPEPLDNQKPGILIIVGIILGIVIILLIVGLLLFKKRKRKKKKKQEIKEKRQAKEEATYYEEETTTRYDINSFKEVESTEEIEKTKEYHFNFNNKN